jgi:hypothetical protein
MFSSLLLRQPGNFESMTQFRRVNGPSITLDPPRYRCHTPALQVGLNAVWRQAEPSRDRFPWDALGRKG